MYTTMAEINNLVNNVININDVIAACTMSAQALFEIPISFSDEEEDSNSEEDDAVIMMISLKKRKLQKPQRIENYVERVVSGLTAQQFQQHFRVTIEAYENLLEIIGPQLAREAPTGRSRVDIETQLLAVIWLLATPDSYRSVGERFNLAKSSLSVCFIRIVKILNAVAPRIIRWPDHERLENIKRRFAGMAGLDKVVGVVDGTYIVIKAPKDDPQSYITRKSNYAFTLQAMADPYLKFTDIFMGYPGSVSDVRIFRNSDIYSLIRNNTIQYFPDEEYILGDKAYPVLPWCIPPYINRENLTRAQQHFNTSHARTRQVIERAFALLFGRFRRLKYVDMNRHDLIPATVLAACVLHNFCLQFNDVLLEEYIREGIQHVQNNEVEDNLPDEIMAEGRMRRDHICRQLYGQRRH